MDDQPEGFYEDDEPDEKIRGAWERGTKGRTSRSRADAGVAVATDVELESIELSGNVIEESRPFEIVNPPNVSIVECRLVEGLNL